MTILTDEEIENCSNFSHNRYRFARAIEAAVLSKLAEQDVDPVGWLCNGELYEVQQYRLFPRDEPIQGQEKLYTDAQYIAAQQRTAEACAKVCDEHTGDPETCDVVLNCAAKIRNGEWREYL